MSGWMEQPPHLRYKVDEKRKKYLSIFYDDVKLMLFSLVWVELIFVSSLLWILLVVFFFLYLVVFFSCIVTRRR